jgi:phosphodiesterase/alkaline phosphatase D-like protein
MNGSILKLAMAAAVGTLISSNPIFAQKLPPAKKAEILPPAKKATRVTITRGPVLESASDYLTVIRWITTNPGGTDVHFGIVHYGTDPKDLSQRANSQIRINRGHPETMFRVRLEGLKPRTSYYYKVTSIESNGKSDGVESPVSKFTTPGSGERFAASELPRPNTQ